MKNAEMNLQAYIIYSIELNDKFSNIYNVKKWLIWEFKSTHITPGHRKNIVNYNKWRLILMTFKLKMW